ncbi:MAG: M23 family metallopeptidase [Clostridium sp.]|nr:M23 family metallopeptidase [Clostridium sp.]
MKNRRHKRKEFYSVLFVSNIDRRNRHFRIARSTLHLLLVLVLVIFAAVGWLSYQAAVRMQQASGLEAQLREQQLAGEQLVSEWEDEKTNWTQEKQTLEEELASVRQDLDAREQELQAIAEAEQEAAAAAEREAAEAVVPTLYPSSGVGVLTSTFSEEHPYISFTAEVGTDIIAAGGGMVTSVRSDDTYRHIIEIEHESGYTTYYLYRHEADLKVEEGDQVQKGDSLFTVTSENTELDYEVLYGDELIDPLSIIAAKG